MIGAQTEELRQITVQVATTVIVPFLVLLTVVAIGVAALDVPATSFRSPDEHASYEFTRTFADTGKLYYTAGYLQRDEENLLHPRGAITQDGKAVPFNYLGLPVIYAPAYKLLGDDTRYIAIPLALIAVAAMASAASAFTPGRTWIAWIAALGATPIIYYLNRPFLNSLPSFTFFAVGVYLLLEYCRRDRSTPWWRLWAASAAFAAAAFCRYEFVIFNTLTVLLLLWHRHRADLKSGLDDVGVYGAVTGALFVGPVLFLNSVTYGSAFTYGYGLFNHAFYPDRAPGAGFPMNLVRIVRSVLLPSYPLDLPLAFKAFTRQVLGVAPIFAAVAGLGLVTLARNKVVPLSVLIAGCAAAIYVYLYRGAGYSWLADSPDGNLEASVVRYSLPLYLVFYLLAVYGLAQVKQSHIAALMVIILAFVGVSGILRDVDGSLMHVRAQVRYGDEVTRRDVLPNVEQDAIVYTDIFDKTIGPYRTVAGWWGGVRGTHDGFFKAREVARSIARVYADHPVYLYLYEEDYVVPRVDEQLASWDLTIESTGVKRLYRVEPVTQRLQSDPRALP